MLARYIPDPVPVYNRSCYIVEPSYMAVAGLVFGRRSFQAFNKEIEVSQMLISPWFNPVYQ